MRDANVAIVVTDPRQPDNPITYVNRAFERLTLYSPEYAIGRNCRFLQGRDTDPAAVQQIREGLDGREQIEVVLRNYRADGSSFLNQLVISPVEDDAGNLTGFFGLQREMTPREEQGDETARAQIRADRSLAMLRELQHRVKNHLSMIVGMVRVQAAREVTAESMQSVGRRIEALSLLYEELLSGDDKTGARHEVAGGAYLSRIAKVIAGLESRSAVSVNIDCDEVDLPVDTAARLGLLLSEFLTNALEHAFDGVASGNVWVQVRVLEGDRVRLTVADDGGGLPAGSNWPYGAESVEEQTDRAETMEGTLDTTGRSGGSGVGGSIVTALIDSLGAELSVESGPSGTTASVELALERPATSA